MRRFWPVAALSLVLVLLLAIYLIVKSNSDTPRPNADTSGNESDPADEHAPKETDSPEQRVKLIQDYASRTTARSGDAFFDKYLADQDGAVRLAAFDKSYELARREGESAPVKVVRKALGNPYRDVQRKALVAAREVKAADLVQDLLDCLSRGGTEGYLALDALAVTNDKRAVEKVCGLAADAKTERSLRIRAVALLAKVDDPKAIEILRNLAAGNDAELAQVAQAALEAKPAK